MAALHQRRASVDCTLPRGGKPSARGLTASGAAETLAAMTAMTTRSLALLPLAALLGCPPPPKAGPGFPPQTTLRSSSARCPDGKSCQCRAEGGEGQGEEKIPAGHKRFEFRLPRTPNAIWVSVEGRGVYYKAPEALAPQCFYVDLIQGEHRVVVRSERRDVEVGLQTGLVVFEHGAKHGPAWYRTLDFVCGGNANRCTKGAMESWVAFQRKLPRGVLDPCGSTMIRDVSAGGARDERLLTDYRELDLSFALKVYGFEPRFSPGSAECRAPAKNRSAPAAE
jgi:hypothetical protein